MPAPARIRSLIDKYDAEADYFRSAAFKEMAIRSEFLNPVLEAMGWNPDNHGFGAADREVIQEDSLIIDGGGKAPDYAFLVERRRMFFMEAKRPGIRIATDRAPAHQIRRYCWNAGLPLGIVTDFEEWAIYDCRSEPHVTDPPSTARIRYFTYKELDQNWDELVSLFGRSAVQEGSLSQFAATTPSPQGTLTVDQAFLNEISEWRASLAVDIAWRNRSLSATELNIAVQTLIDRIVFLRIAEARGLEEIGGLQKAAEEGTSGGVYKRLMSLFRRADDRYNSGLFHFHEAKGQAERPDRVGPKLVVSDDVLRQIVVRLYYPYPYEFSVMPADILGRVYEQFLGATISLKGHTAVVEEKPEVRKAGGVYYTPTPIVDYIVGATLGPLLKGASPNDVAKLKIVDPACGSGSFLIAAYQYLIDWHTVHYEQTPRNKRKYLEGTLSGGLRLRTEERKRILSANIFGVDIDPQAVEVTKLSLLLKVIEGQGQLELELGRILPDLGANVRCGNSLIDVDFPLPLDPTDEERLRYNPFNWGQEFPQVFRNGAGGFDAVIGNPPYLSIDAVWGKKDARLAYIKSHYAEIQTDKTDILFYFFAKAVEICRGEIGFIVSRSFLEADKAQKLRGWLSTHSRVREVVDFREATVFPRVGINTAIVRLTGSKAVRSAVFRQYRRKSLPPGYLAGHLSDPKAFVVNHKPLGELGTAAWISTDDFTAALLAKIDSSGVPVGQILHVGQGMQTGSNTAFVVPPAQAELLEAARRGGVLAKRARNSDIHAFDIHDDGPSILYLEDARFFTALPPLVRRHLSQSRGELESRAAFQRGDCEWWKYTWPLHKEYLRRPRILVPYRAKVNRFAVDPAAEYLGLTDTTVLYDDGQPEDLDYIAAVLNSKVMTYRFRYIGKLVGGGTYEYFHNTVGKLVVPRRTANVEAHDAISKLGRLAAEQASIARSTLVRAEQKHALDSFHELQEQIEGRVAALFGLTMGEREAINVALSEVAAE